MINAGISGEELVDPESGLRNETALKEDLEWEIARMKRYGHRFAVLMFEPRTFIPIESCLKLANLVKEILRATDILYRLPDCRFAAILPCSHETGGECAALRLRRVLAKKTEDYPEGPVDIDVGVVSVDIHMQMSSSEIIEKANSELTEAKHLREAS